MRFNGKPMLLIAEDDPDDQEFIQEAIAAACPPEVELRFVKNGVELIEYLRHDDQQAVAPRLILLDLNMPRKDGRVALQEIKGDPELSRIPIVILTTSGSEADKGLCQELGAEAFYRKPNRMAELKSILAYLCAQYLSTPGTRNA